MAEVNTIAEALRSVVDTGIADVDQSSISGYEPLIETQTVALQVVPFRQADTYEWADLSGTKLLCRHTLQLEFWIRIESDAASVAAAMQRARDMGVTAAKLLATNDGTGYQLDPEAEMPMSYEVEDAIFAPQRDTAYIRGRLSVRVRNEVSV